MVSLTQRTRAIDHAREHDEHIVPKTRLGTQIRSRLGKIHSERYTYGEPSDGDQPAWREVCRRSQGRRRACGGGHK